MARLIFTFAVLALTATSLLASALSERLYIEATAMNRTGSFVQTKYLKDVDLSLKASGAYLLRPDQKLILWQTVKPFAQAFLLKPQGIYLYKANEFERVTNANDAATQCILQILSGDKTRLDETFSIEDTEIPDESQWTITLLPKDALLKAWLTSIILQGEHNQLLGVTLNYLSGDTVRQQFTPTETPPMSLEPLLKHLPNE